MINTLGESLRRQIDRKGGASYAESMVGSSSLYGLVYPMLGSILRTTALSGALILSFPLTHPATDFRPFSVGSKVEVHVTTPPLIALSDIHLEYHPPPATTAPVVAQIGRSEDLTSRLIDGAHPPEVRRLQPLKIDGLDVINSVAVAPSSTRSLVKEPESQFLGGGQGLAVRKGSDWQAASSTIGNPLLAGLSAAINSEGTRELAIDGPTPRRSLAQGRAQNHGVERSTPAKPDLLDDQRVDSYSTHRGLARELAGYLELREGLALTGGGQELTVYRQHMGERHDVGHIYHDRGEFEIYVRELKGELVAELRDRSGHTQGYGSLNLDKVFSESFRISNLSLYIDPVRVGFSGVVYDFASSLSTASLKGLPDVRINFVGYDDFLRTVQDGAFFDGEVLPGSSGLVLAEKEGYLPTYSYLQEGKKAQLPLFEQSYFDGIRSPGSSQQAAHQRLQSAVVVGRVFKDGKPYSGGRVEHLDPVRAKVVYLGEEGLPIPNQTQTGSSGLFLLMDVLPGLTGLKVSALNGVVEHRILPAGENSVTYLEVHVDSSVPVQVAYSSFPGGELVPMATRTLASDELWTPQMSSHVELSLSPGGPAFIVADGDGEYEPMTYTTQREASRLDLPVVDREWLKSIYLQSQAPTVSGSGQIFGWANTRQSFVVELDVSDEDHAIQVVYLDQQGNPLWGAAEGAVGGSFLILNVGEGLRKIRIHYPGERYASCVAYVEEGTTAVCAL